MKIAILSDLHCRNKSFPEGFDIARIPDADVLAVAGDLGVERTHDRILAKLEEAAAGRFGSVVSVRGNHDYYNTDPHHTLPGRMHVPSVWDNRRVLVDDAAFLCTTLWTPVRRDSPAHLYMNDYNYIPGFTPERCTELFHENLAWLESSAAEMRGKGFRIVVLTHHLPRRELIDPRYLGQPAEKDANAGFCILDDALERRAAAIRPVLWIHGHSHNRTDLTIDGTRYVRNPYGYEWRSHSYADGHRKEETGYDPSFIVEI